MTGWTAQRIADASGGQLVSGAEGSPAGWAIDSREVGPGEVFVGIPGARADGGAFAADVIARGAWGAIVTPAHSEAAAAADGAVIAHPDPVRALGLIATEHRRTLDCSAIGITGSSGKTSTKDILAAVLGTAGVTVATRGNRNTEIGMPLEILRADADTRFLVLEMAMRGRGQIAELAAIAKPDVGVIVSIGPAHLDLLGSIEAIAAAKAELIAGLREGAVAVVPAGEALLDPHLRDDLRTVTFGGSGDVRLLGADGRDLSIDLNGSPVAMSVDFDQPHNRTNLLAALAAADAVGVRPPRDLHVTFSSLRGDRIAIGRGIVLIDDCYNSNPASAVAGLRDLAEEAARRGGRSVAVLGDMLELGPGAHELHVAVGAEAERVGVGLLVTVGDLAPSISDGFGGRSVHFADAAGAAEAMPALLEAGDTVLVKGSRGVGLEVVGKRLVEED